VTGNQPLTTPPVQFQYVGPPQPLVQPPSSVQPLNSTQQVSCSMISINDRIEYSIRICCSMRRFYFLKGDLVRFRIRVRLSVSFRVRVSSRVRVVE
jgi:hypothetical protein